MIIDAQDLKHRLDEVKAARAVVANAERELKLRLEELEAAYLHLNTDVSNMLVEARSQLGWETSWESSYD